jgi:hypothetical protein
MADNATMTGGAVSEGSSTAAGVLHGVAVAVEVEGGKVEEVRAEGVVEEQRQRMEKRMMGPSDLKAGLGGKRSADEVAQIIYEASKGAFPPCFSTLPPFPPVLPFLRFIESLADALLIFRQARHTSRIKNGNLHFPSPSSFPPLSAPTHPPLVHRKDKDLEAKSTRLRQHLIDKRKEARGNEEETVDRILEQLEEKRDLSRVIALIDADAFYAACHQREDPTLEGKPFGVGGGGTFFPLLSPFRRRRADNSPLHSPDHRIVRGKEIRRPFRYASLPGSEALPATHLVRHCFSFPLLPSLPVTDDRPLAQRQALSRPLCQGLA